MRRATFLFALLLPAPLGAQNFCTDALMGACFYVNALHVEEVESAVSGRSDYLHTLTGVWTGSALSGLTDFYWLARFDAYQTSAEGRTVHVFAMTADEPTQAWHDEWGQPQGLAHPLWDYMSIRIFRGLPGNGTSETIMRCGGSLGPACYRLADAPITFHSLTHGQPPTPPTNSEPVSVPEPATALLLLPGLLALAHRRRSRTRLA